MRVILQMPIEVNDGSIRLFSRPDTEMVHPVIGSILFGSFLPDVLGPGFPGKTIVREISEDLDKHTVFINVQGCQEPSYTAEELLQQMEPDGWQLHPAPLRPPKPVEKSGSEEG